MSSATHGIFMAQLTYTQHTLISPSVALARLPLFLHCMSAAVFPQTYIEADLFQAAALYLGITHANTHTETHTLTAYKQRRTGRENLSHAHTHSHMHAHLLTHTLLYTPPLRQKTHDYSANGCTTDHRAGLLQTALLCSLSVGWKCCRGPRQCGFGALRGLCVCVCVHTHQG